jgi:hypothetical protein
VNTGNARWLIEPAQLSSGDSDQEASAGAVVFLEAANGVANAVQYSPAYQAILTPTAAREVVRLVVWRNGTAGTDTFTGIGRLIGVILRYTATLDAGPAGAAGAAGTSGVAGPPGMVYYEDPEFIIFPGPTGATGTPGADGAPGAAGSGGGSMYVQPQEEEPTFGMWTPHGQRDTQTVMWSSKKRISSGQASQRIYLPEPCNVLNVYFTLPASSTATATIDVKKNGTTIFTGSGPTLTSGYISNVVVPTTQAMTPTDYLTVHVTYPGNTGGRLIAYITTRR